LIHAADETFMRKALVVALLGVVIVGCDNPSVTPTGPGTVVVETPSPPTTTIPPSSIPTTTTSTIPLATTRLYVAFGQVAPTSPSQLTLVLTGGPTSWIVMGNYQTAAGGNGLVKGSLAGNLDAGTFQGTLTSETPECVAERAFSGSVDKEFLRWTGAATLADCKGNPLAFNALVMLPTGAPPPMSTINSTSTIPVQCSYALSASSVSVPTTGGQASVALTTGPTCGWTVQNFVEWITVVPVGGTGAASIALTVAPGPPRSATLVIAGTAFVVNQVASTAAVPSVGLVRVLN
jgi:hypothetical protein